MINGKYKVTQVVVHLENGQVVIYTFGPSDKAYYKRSTNYQMQKLREKARWLEHHLFWTTDRIEENVS